MHYGILLKSSTVEGNRTLWCLLHKSLIFSLTLNTICASQIYSPVVSQLDIKNSLSSDASSNVFLMIGRKTSTEMLTFLSFLKSSASNLVLLKWHAPCLVINDVIDLSRKHKTISSGIFFCLFLKVVLYLNLSRC